MHPADIQAELKKRDIQQKEIAVDLGVSPMAVSIVVTRSWSPTALCGRWLPESSGSRMRFSRNIISPSIGEALKKNPRSLGLRINHNGGGRQCLNYGHGSTVFLDSGFRRNDGNNDATI